MEIPNVLKYKQKESQGLTAQLVVFPSRKRHPKIKDCLLNYHLDNIWTTCGWQSHEKMEVPLLDDVDDTCWALWLVKTGVMWLFSQNLILKNNQHEAPHALSITPFLVNLIRTLSSAITHQFWQTVVLKWHNRSSTHLFTYILTKREGFSVGSLGFCCVTLASTRTISFLLHKG